jgi:uncharacterized linocin/CFP29 family protein
MDILKRNLAPITSEAWAEIDDQATKILTNELSARKVVDLDGPHGWDHSAVTLGRLTPLKQNIDSPVEAGVRTVRPLIEVRVPFSLDVQEIDNIVRGAQDIDLEPLESAARALAKFEETAVYYGFSEAGIKGLVETTPYNRLTLADDAEQILEQVNHGLTQLMGKSIEGPYALVASPELWLKLSSHVKGYPLKTHLESLLGGPVVVSPYVCEAFIVSMRGGDMALTVGQDIGIGYGGSDGKMVHLFFVESFTFGVYEPASTLVLDCKTHAG